MSKELKTPEARLVYQREYREKNKAEIKRKQATKEAKAKAKEYQKGYASSPTRLAYRATRKIEANVYQKAYAKKRREAQKKARVERALEE